MKKVDSLAPAVVQALTDKVTLLDQQIRHLASMLEATQSGIAEVLAASGVTLTPSEREDLDNAADLMDTIKRSESSKTPTAPSRVPG